MDQNMTGEKFRCCACCPNDPSFHEDNPPDSHEIACSICDNPLRGRLLEAEAKLSELRRILLQGGQDAASVRREAIAFLTT